MSNTNTNAVNVLAISKVIKEKAEKEARSNVGPGSYAVNCLVRVQGTMNVGEDYKQNKTASMPQMKMLLAALMLNGTSAKAFVRRYLDGEFAVTEDQEKEMKAMWDEMASSFESDFKGKVTTKLAYEVVEEVPEIIPAN